MPTRQRASRQPGSHASTRAESLELIRTLVDGLSTSARALERRTGITNAQLFLLQQLEDGDGLSLNELAERGRTQQSTASIVVSRLVRARLIHKARSSADGRRTVLTLTPAAKRLLRNAPAPPTARLVAALATLPPDDVLALTKGLSGLVHALGLGGTNPPMLFER